MCSLKDKHQSSKLEYVGSSPITPVNVSNLNLMYLISKATFTQVSDLDTSLQFYLAVDLARAVLKQRTGKTITHVWANTNIFFALQKDQDKFRNWMKSFDLMPVIVPIKNLSFAYVAALEKEDQYFTEPFVGYPSIRVQRDPSRGITIVPTQFSNFTEMRNRY